MNKNNIRNISYLNKGFNEFKENLINFSKTYFPSSYRDYTEASIGMMFIEMASYIGDVLSFYEDVQFQENLLLLAKEKANLINMAYAFGYHPQLTYASNVDTELFQLVPKISDGLGNDIPDENYYMSIPQYSSVSSLNGTNFILIEQVDFYESSNREITLFDNDYFLVKKTTKAISATVKEQVVNVGVSPKKFNRISLSDTNIIRILSITDESSNLWYEVPYLSEDKIVVSTKQTGDFNIFNYNRIPNRYVTRINKNEGLDIIFGAGVLDPNDDTLIPNINSLQLGVIDSVYNVQNYNKAHILLNQEYGLAPTGNLTIKYIVGGGIESNIPSNNIKTFNFSESDISWFGNTDPTLASSIFNNIIINNPNAASGGKGGDTVEEIRQNTLGSFSSQSRAITKEDYINKTLSLPGEFGNIAKAYIQNSPQYQFSEIKDPFALDLYILSYDNEKKLTPSSSLVKENLKKYLEKFKAINDRIIIRDAFIINIGINFDITVSPGFSNKEILVKCIESLKEEFNIELIQINQPIILDNINKLLNSIKGVQSVKNIEIINKSGGMYSLYEYDIKSATRNNVIYPSFDPNIFEIKFPDIDIKGRVVTL